MQLVDNEQQETKAPDQPDAGENSKDSQYSSRSYAASDSLDDNEEK